MGNVLKSPKMTEFQKEKLLYEFDTFFDLNKDGGITFQDFKICQQHMCKLNGWAEDDEKTKLTEAVFASIHETLMSVSDLDKDGRVTPEEWLIMWQQLYKTVFEKKDHELSAEDLPLWCHRYLQQRFYLFDRTNDGIIDKDEYEYVLEQFGVSAVNARRAFTMITQLTGDRPFNFDLFSELATQYYFTNEPSAPGNFINGKVDFNAASDKKAHLKLDLKTV